MSILYTTLALWICSIFKTRPSLRRFFATPLSVALSVLCFCDLATALQACWTDTIELAPYLTVDDPGGASKYFYIPEGNQTPAPTPALYEPTVAESVSEYEVVFQAASEGAITLSIIALPLSASVVTNRNSSGVYTVKLTLPATENPYDSLGGLNWIKSDAECSYSQAGFCFGHYSSDVQVLSYKKTNRYCPKCDIAAASSTKVSAAIGPAFYPTLKGSTYDGSPYGNLQTVFKLISKPAASKVYFAGNISSTRSSDGLSNATLVPDVAGTYIVEASVPSKADPSFSYCSPQKITYEYTIVKPCVSGTMEVLDPMPSLLVGDGEITSNPASLQKYLPRIFRIAGDGVTQALLRIHDCANTTYTLSVSDEDKSPPTQDFLDEVGGIGPIGSTSFNKTLNVTTDSDGWGYAVYRAPSDYVRKNFLGKDLEADKRMVTLSLARSGIEYSDSTVEVIRPPVFLIHGLHSNPDAFGNFAPVNGSYSRFSSYSADYSQKIAVANRQPSYSSIFGVRAHSMGLDFNAPMVLRQLTEAVAQFRSERLAAATQADVVAHSFGGLIARKMYYLDRKFFQKLNYGKGYVHKLITLGTPHLGSPVASRLFDGANDCSASGQTSSGWHIIRSATVSGRVYAGAVYDLQGGATLATSFGIRQIQGPFPYSGSTTPPVIKMAMIAGQLPLSSYARLDSPANAARIAARTLCGTVTLEFPGTLRFGLNQPGTTIRVGDPLADLWTASRWDQIFYGLRNDGLVDIKSGLLDSTIPLIDAGHSSGTVSIIDPGFGYVPGLNVGMGFGGMHLLQTQSGAPTEVVELLNTPISDPIFIDYP